MVELAEAGCKFATRGTGSRDNDDGTSGFDVGVCAVSFVGNNGIDVVGVALGELVDIDLFTHAFKLITEDIGRGLLLVLGNDHGVYK